MPPKPSKPFFRSCCCSCKISSMAMAENWLRTTWLSCVIVATVRRLLSVVLGSPPHAVTALSKSNSRAWFMLGRPRFDIMRFQSSIRNRISDNCLELTGCSGVSNLSIASCCWRPSGPSSPPTSTMPLSPACKFHGCTCFLEDEKKKFGCVIWCCRSSRPQSDESNVTLSNITVKCYSQNLVKQISNQQLAPSRHISILVKVLNVLKPLSPSSWTARLTGQLMLLVPLQP